MKRTHKADGSLPPGVKSFDTPQHSNSNSNKNSNNDGNSERSSSSADVKKKNISFNMANFSEPSEIPLYLGPIIESGALYSAIGLINLNMLADHFGLQSNPSLDPIF